MTKTKTCLVAVALTATLCATAVCPVVAQAATTPATAAYTVRTNGFEENADLAIEKKGGVTLGTANKDGGVAEIVSYDAKHKRAYVVNGQAGVLDVVPMNDDGTFGTHNSVDIKQKMTTASPDFTYGDMTSVAVDPTHDRVAVSLQHETYSENGRVALLDPGHGITKVYETGVQPDMVTFSADGRYILTANEGEPRNGYGAGEIDPEGSVTVIDTQTEQVQTATFTNFQSADLAAKGVVFNASNGTPFEAAKDLEPEYIAVNGGTAYVSLQEANAIAVLDIGTARFTDVLPLGFKDYSLEKNAIDLSTTDPEEHPDDFATVEKYALKTYANTYGVYMPDGISVYEKDGKTYLFTANEGDAREWGDKALGQTEFTDEARKKLTSTDGVETEKKVRVLDKEVKAGLGDGDYLYGGRSFSIFEVTETGLTLTYDSANEFESKTHDYLPDYYNCSNDSIVPDDRSSKKGVEPEAVTLATVGERTYAFIALERIGGLMVYDVTDPAAAKYVNYVNTRDFSADMAGDVAPEGLAVATVNGSPVLLAAFEVSGTLASYSLTAKATDAPVPPATNPGTDGTTPPTAPEASAPGEGTGTGVTNTADPEKDPLPVGWIIGGCFIGVAVIAGGVVLFLRMKKKS